MTFVRFPDQELSVSTLCNVANANPSPSRRVVRGGAVRSATGRHAHDCSPQVMKQNFPEWQITRPQEEGGVRVSHPLGLGAVRAMDARSGGLQERKEVGDGYCQHRCSRVSSCRDSRSRRDPQRRSRSLVHRCSRDRCEWTCGSACERCASIHHCRARRDRCYGRQMTTRGIPARIEVPDKCGKPRLTRRIEVRRVRCDHFPQTIYLRPLRAHNAYEVTIDRRHHDVRRDVPFPMTRRQTASPVSRSPSDRRSSLCCLTLPASPGFWHSWRRTVRQTSRASSGERHARPYRPSPSYNRHGRRWLPIGEAAPV